ERGLAGSQLAAYQHHIAGVQPSGELGAERFGLRGMGGLDDANGHDARAEPTARRAVKYDRPAGERGTGRSLLLEGWRQGLYRQPSLLRLVLLPAVFRRLPEIPFC